MRTQRTVNHGHACVLQRDRQRGAALRGALLPALLRAPPAAADQPAHAATVRKLTDAHSTAVIRNGHLEHHSCLPTNTKASRHPKLDILCFELSLARCCAGGSSSNWA